LVTGQGADATATADGARGTNTRFRFVEVDWDTALDLVAGALRDTYVGLPALVAEHGASGLMWQWSSTAR
jgi:anaerobic selenocysteine-containing dehydrogenase